MSKIEVRPVTKEEIPLLFDMLQNFADYLAEPLGLTEESLASALFQEQSCHVLLALKGETPAGFALYYYTFTTILGKKGIYLLNLFVEEVYRGQGVGKTLFQKLAQVALENNCGRLDWDCLNSNQAGMEVYQKMGAHDRNDHTFFRFEANEVERLAQG